MRVTKLCKLKFITMTMKASKAVKMLESAGRAMQKARSVWSENGLQSELAETSLQINNADIQETTFKHEYIFGDKCFLISIFNAIDKYYKTGNLEPLTFLNIMTLIQKTIPVINVMSDINLLDPVDIRILQGWEPEN